MYMALRLISLFILSVCFSQAWASVATPSFKLSYSYDESIEYNYGSFEIETSGISSKNHIYDVTSNLSICCSKQPLILNGQSTCEGYYFVLIGEFKATKRAGKNLRPVGKLFESVNDVLTNPKLLSGKSPGQVQAIIGKTPGWKIETLGKGSKKGQGWVFRQYTNRGDSTGQSIRWHPGSARKGGEPYWRVTSNVVGKSDVIR